ncbi:hypothetical protein [Embleya sp. AB8]|uniref:hypothetical protein n=1 Tax=Embleya sp. AB8 TaxID=3156304 RepID=UPI003C751532
MTERDAHNEPMEELLRAALGARADGVTAHHLRPSGPPGATTRTGHSRWTTMGIPLSAVLLAAAAFAGVSLAGAPETDRSTPLQSQVPVPLPTAVVSPSLGVANAVPPESASVPGPSETPESDPPPSSTPPPSRPPSSNPPSTSPSSSAKPKSSDVAAVHFDVQPSWRVVREDAMHECVLADARFAGDCLGHGAWVNVKPVPDPDGNWPTETTVDKDEGGLTQPLCMRDGKSVPIPTAGAITMKLTTKSTVTVAGQPAKYRSWTVTCADVGSYQIRLWWLVDQGVYVHTTGLPAGDDLADRVVASLDLSGFRPATGG